MLRSVRGGTKVRLSLEWYAWIMERAIRRLVHESIFEAMEGINAPGKARRGQFGSEERSSKF